MLEIFSWIILVIEAIILLLIIFNGVVDKEIFDVRTFQYIFPLFIINVIIQGFGMYFSKSLNGSNIFINILYCINETVETFAFHINTEHILEALNSCEVFNFAYFISCLMNGATLISSIIGLFKVSAVNYFAYLFNLIFGKDIVVGYCENSLNYVENNKRTILLIDSNKFKLTKEDKIEMYSRKIRYRYLNINIKKISILLSLKLFCKQKNIIFFMSNNDDNLLHYVEMFRDAKKSICKKKNVSIRFEVKKPQVNFMYNQLTIISKEIENVILERENKNILKKHKKVFNPIDISCFSLSDIIGRKFISENNYLDYLPAGYIEDGVLQKDINVFFLGFGETNKSIFMNNILNNHFVRIKDNKYENYPVNYYLYDTNAQNFNDHLLTRLMMDYDKVNEDGNHIEKIANINYKKINIKSTEFLNDLDNIVNENNHNIFFINFSNNGENITFAELIENYLIKYNKVIYYKVNTEKESNLYKTSKNVIPYGFEKDILLNKNIVNDELIKQAKIMNNNYQKLSNQSNIEWNQLPLIEKYSNIYNALNIKFKLQLLDPSYKDLNLFLKNKRDFQIKLFGNKSIEEINDLISYKNYKDFFGINKRCALAFMEHLRWNAYYFVHNYNTMLFKEIKYDKELNKFINKDKFKKKHSCLIAYYELNNLINYLYNEVSKNNYDLKHQIDYYKSDFEFCDNLYENVKAMEENK